LARFDDANENVNLYCDSGNIDQFTKNDLFATVPSPISENKTKLYISPFIIY
jgi:hypothetical protein